LENNVKSIYLVIFLAFSGASTPQDNAPYTTAPDLVVIKSKLGSIIRVDITRPDPPPNDNQYSRIGVNPPPPMYEWRGKAELEVQNTGSKSIKRIYWEFFLMVEENSVQASRSYQIRSKKTIRPGQTVKVAGWIKDIALKELREQLKKGSLQGRAEIKRIDYANGGIWLPLKVKPK
jgi:hypothetical protein